MATAWNSSTYKAPEKLDISVLGKALQYKQTEYDTNVGQTQQLINQYAGTDLLKDIDKEYFGERLSTLVNYINESGTRDWSRKSIARDVQSYVSSALDDNVLNAIGSTQVYRKQMAEIEDIKKNKPDQYSAQNEWFATQDLPRYLSSGQVGDSYRAQSYVPYTDVNKAILENSKYLEKFGAEYYTTAEGNSYFRYIKNHEKVDTVTANQFLETIMDGKIMNQLYIDGQYEYKDKNDTELKSQYDSKLNSYIDYNKDKINELKTLSVSATKDKKAEYESQISKLETNSNDINKFKLTQINRATMASYLHNNNFKDKWTGFLAYDKVIDTKMDDSGFQMWKAEKDIEENNRNYSLKAAEFNYNMVKDQADYNLKKDEIELKAKSSGMVKDASGQWVVDPNAPISGMKSLEGVVDPKIQVISNPFTTKQNEFNSNVGLLTTSVASDIEKILADPDNAELKKQMGSNNPRQVAFMLLNAPSKNKAIYNLLPDNSKQIVDKSISSKLAITDADANLDMVRNDMRKYGNAILSDKTKYSTKKSFAQSTAGLTLDANGNVVKGNILDRNDQMATAARTIGAINFRLMSGNLSDDEVAQYKRMALKELVGTGMNQKQIANAYDKLVFRKTYNGFWDGLGQVVTEGLVNNTSLPTILTGAQTLYNSVSDSKDKATFAQDFIKYGQSALWNGNRRGATGEISDRVTSMLGKVGNLPIMALGKVTGNNTDQMAIPGSINADTNSIGLSDIDVDKLGFDPSNMEQRWKAQTDAVRDKLSKDKNTIINKSLNIDLGSKYGKTVIGDLQSYLPVGSEIQKDGTAKIVMDQKTGIANVTIGVKDGKTYEPQTVQVKIADLPQTVLNSVKQEATTNLYSATNPYAVRYVDETEIPDNKQDWAKKVALMPKNQRTDAFNNPPMTKDDIVNNLSAVYGKEIVQQNSKQIQELLNKPVSINMIPENEQWTFVANQDGANIIRKPTGKDSYDPRLMEKYSTELVTNLILENIKKTLNK